MATQLMLEGNIQREAARKRISRVRKPIYRFPVNVLPKGEKFLYLDCQRSSEQFWTAFHNALRETRSVFGYAIDAIVPRAGVIPTNEFAVVSGAPIAMKKQVSASRLLATLIEAGVLEKIYDPILGDCVALSRYELGRTDFNEARTRRIVERIVLDGVREWIRNLGFGSYNSVAIRGDARSCVVGPFTWDLTAPSYLQPLTWSNDKSRLAKSGSKLGFVAADVFAGSTLDEFHIRYFIHKSGLVKAAIPAPVLPILIADRFTKQALYEGRSNGVLMATPTNLFGDDVGKALVDLTHTLRNAAAVVAKDPKKLVYLIETLSAIEGSAGNLRGTLFELMAAYLARNNARSIDVGVTATDPETKRSSDIDVLQIRTRDECTCIECKAKLPGGTVTLEEVEKWLKCIPIYRGYLRANRQFQEMKISYELWTTGSYDDDALEKLNYEKQRRSVSEIAWYDGETVYEIATRAKESSISDTLRNHILKNPLA